MSYNTKLKAIIPNQLSTFNTLYYTFCCVNCDAPANPNSALLSMFNTNCGNVSVFHNFIQTKIHDCNGAPGLVKIPKKTYLPIRGLSAVKASYPSFV